MRTIVSFDCDGVLAAGPFVPRELRTPEFYFNMPLMDISAPAIVNKLVQTHDVYVVSARDYQDATQATRHWMAASGFDMAAIAGVVCHIAPMQKPQFLTMLGATLHFDDDPMVIVPLGDRGVLFNNPSWEENQKYVGKINTVMNWMGVVTCLDLTHRMPLDHIQQELPF